MGVRDVGAARGQLVQLVELLHAMEDGLLRRLLYLASEEELVEDHVNLGVGRRGT